MNVPTSPPLPRCIVSFDRELGFFFLTVFQYIPVVLCTSPRVPHAVFTHLPVSCRDNLVDRSIRGRLDLSVYIAPVCISSPPLK